MTRKQKLFLNSTTSLAYQFVALICGFILPRVFLSTYGSAVNGLISSVTQFLGFISLCEMGVGAVIQSTLYKPLADGDGVTVSKIAKSSDRFFRTIAYILVGYTLVLMVGYPLITIDKFDYFYTFALILVISISTFAQYYFGMTYRLILSADQLGFIHFAVHTVSLVINTIVCVWFMHIGLSVHIVKLATSLIFLVQPVAISIIAKRKYRIDRSVVLTEEPIKQKWNGLAQHIAAVVLGNTDVVVLTLLSTLNNVSVYSVYYLVVNGVKQIVISLTNGMQAMFGNMLAKNEMQELNQSFDVFEWLMHTFVTVVFYITAFALVPFVRVYTDGITDVNYIVPTFAVLIAISQAVICLQLPYKNIVLAAGHYKQTQWSSIVEAVVNIVVSVILVWRYGLIGVALGTIAAVLYRLLYMVWYLKKNIINRKLFYFIKHIVVDIVSIAVYAITCYYAKAWLSLGQDTWGGWVELAVKVSLICMLECVLLNTVLHFRKIKQVLAWVVSSRKRSCEL